MVSKAKSKTKFTFYWKSLKESVLYLQISFLRLLQELHLDFPERPQPWLTGADVMRALSLKPGPEVGKILRLAWHAQLARKLNSREEALGWLDDVASS